jgi:hypothetical protein
MVYYVAHSFGGDNANIERAKKITHDLQIKDLENCYICPLLAFSNLKYGEISYEKEMDICLDLLMICDVLIVASTITKGVKMEIDLAKRLNMGVYVLGKNGDLRPFTE